MRNRDRGTAALEYLSMFGLFLLVLLLCEEAYVSFSVIEKVENAARTGARVGSWSGEAAGRDAARRSLPGWIIQPRVEVTEIHGDSIRCKVTARIPVLFKSTPIDLPITREVEMPIGG